jgi:hypothetical protein
MTLLYGNLHYVSLSLTSTTKAGCLFDSLNLLSYLNINSQRGDGGQRDFSGIVLGFAVIAFAGAFVAFRTVIVILLVAAAVVDGADHFVNVFQPKHTTAHLVAAHAVMREMHAGIAILATATDIVGKTVIHAAPLQTIIFHQ